MSAYFLRVSGNSFGDAHLFVTWENTMAVLFKLGYQCKFCVGRDCLVIAIALMSRIVLNNY